MTKNDKKLELTWYHKDKSLYYDLKEKKYLWVDKKDPRVSEPRIFLEKAAYGDRDAENMLIKGDNLLALKALLQDFRNKIKLIYIDPPFNTGSAFEYYDDGLEHSIWLTMMRDRLKLLHDLLKKDGVIFVEIDDTEVAYLSVLLDEIFGRKNRVVNISIKRSAATGHKAINPAPVNVTEYLIVYCKDKTEWRYKQQHVLREKYDRQYSKFIENYSEDYQKWRFINLADKVATELGYSSASEARKKLSSKVFEKEVVKFAVGNPEGVIRFALPNYKGVSQAARELIDKSKSDGEKVYLLKREDFSDMFFYKGNRILFLEDKVRTVNGEKGIVEPLTNFWDDIGWQGIAKEGNVEFPKGKKPEKLIKRILEIGSKESDWILDSFAGSGTTGAVAHKMGRKWIMVEFSDQVKTHCLKRLKEVVEGKDQTGISKEINWRGGSGFKYFELGDSLFVADDDLRLTVLNPKVYNGTLIRAVLKVEGFKLLNPNNALHGVSGRTIAHVTEQYLNQDYVSAILREVGDAADYLIVYAKTISSKIKLPENVEIRKIPDVLLKKFKV